MIVHKERIEMVKRIEKMLFILLIGVLSVFITDNVYAEGYCDYNGDFGRIIIYKNGTSAPTARYYYKSSKAYETYGDSYSYGVAFYTSNAKNISKFESAGTSENAYIRYTLESDEYTFKLNGSECPTIYQDPEPLIENSNSAMGNTTSTTIKNVLYRISLKHDTSNYFSVGVCPTSNPECIIDNTVSPDADKSVCGYTDYNKEIDNREDLTAEQKQAEKLQKPGYYKNDYKKDGSGNLEFDASGNPTLISSTYIPYHMLLDDSNTFYQKFWSIRKNVELELQNTINEKLTTFDLNSWNRLFYNNSPGAASTLLRTQLADIVGVDGIAELQLAVKDWNDTHGCTIDDAVWQQYVDSLNSLVDEYTIKARQLAYKTLDTAVNNGQIDQQTANEFKNTVDEQLDQFRETSGRLLSDVSAWYQKLIKVVDESCTGILDPELVDIINEIFNWVKIIVPILLIVLSVVDYSKAVLSAEKDELQQTTKKLTKRIVIAIIIFFVPTIIHLFVNIYNNVSPIPLTDLPDCGIK